MVNNLTCGMIRKQLVSKNCTGRNIFENTLKKLKVPK